MTNVFENTQKLDVEEPKKKPFKSTTITEDLTDIKGIGPSTASKLNKANINTIKQLADITPDELSIISGVNINTAEKFISEAKKHLPEYEFETFDVAEIIIDEKLLQQEFKEEEKSNEPEEKWFEEKFDYSRLSASYPPVTENPLDESQIASQETEEPFMEQNDEAFNEESFTVEKPVLEEDPRDETPVVPEIIKTVEEDFVSKELVVLDKQGEMKNKIVESLKNGGYYLIPTTINPLQPFMENIDYIGCKLIRVSKWVNHIFLIPIQICDLEGTVLIDEVKIDYKPKRNSSKTDGKSRLRQYYRNLISTRDLIFKDIINNSKFREFFQKYFQVNLTLEKSVENKKLFFISGQTQYKVLLEPIMLCEAPPRCMEKKISFPYQRNTNIHVIHQADLFQLLEFLEHKYQIIESRTTNSNIIKDYEKMDKKFRSNVRIASIPLVIYGIGLAIVYFVRFFSLLRIFNSIGFAVVGIYILLLAYLYFKSYRTKKKLAFDFETPYYMQNLDFSEVDLLELKDHFSTEYIAQFGYECFGKERNFKVLEKIEKESFLNSIEAKKEATSPQFLFEPEEKKETVSYESSKYNNKYLSFLDD